MNGGRLRISLGDCITAVMVKACIYWRWEMEIKRIGVIGAGTMGHGIALVSARSGHDVIMSDVEEKFVNRFERRGNHVDNRQ